MYEDDLKAKLTEIIPDAIIEVEDTTGTMDHFRALIISDKFEGKSKIQRHQMVINPLQEYFDTNEIHALALKAFTPAEWQKLTS